MRGTRPWPAREVETHADTPSLVLSSQQQMVRGIKTSFKAPEVRAACARSPQRERELRRERAALGRQEVPARRQRAAGERACGAPRSTFSIIEPAPLSISAPPGRHAHAPTHSHTLHAPLGPLRAPLRAPPGPTRLFHRSPHPADASHPPQQPASRRSLAPLQRGRRRPRVPPGPGGPGKEEKTERVPTQHRSTPTLHSHHLLLYSSSPPSAPSPSRLYLPATASCRSATPGAA